MDKNVEFNAENMRELANNFHNSEFIKIKNEIISSAKKGESKIEINYKLSSFTINKLKDLQFDVNCQQPAVVDKTGIYYIIDWYEDIY